MYAIKTGGQTIRKFSSEHPARLWAIKLRRDGWGMVYVERV